MAENINTGTAIVKTDDAQGAAVIANSAAALSDTEFADRLEAIARDIETFERTRRKMILRIAKLASEAHKLFKYRRNEGGFTGWMKTRLGCSSSNAYRLLDVHKRFGDGESFPNWETLSDSALYLLAPPSVPKEALDAVAERVEAGEKPSCAEVNEVIAAVKSAAAAASTQTDEDSGTAAHRAAMARLAESAEDAPESVDESVEQPTETVPFPTTSKKKPSPLESFGRAIKWLLNTCETAVELEIPPLDAQQRSTALTALKEAELALHSLADRLTDGADQAASDDKILRDLMLEEFFARASGADIYDRIPVARLDEVIATFLDKLTVEGMRTRMSEEFGRELRARLPAPPKSGKPFKKGLNHPANSTRTRRGHRSRH
jgi:hypothetical protein